MEIRTLPACPPGADKYSRMLCCPVSVLHIQRMTRGHYDVTLHELQMEQKIWLKV
ncbi:MAG: hypothetical protein IPL55_09680 [Saprospiraceae bacterium]|nr:hypothetical protein [Saprospiraceae bacterium]